MKIVLASRNAKKIAEVRRILAEFPALSGIEVLSLDDVGIFGEIEEDGTTFEENALIKARAASKALGLPALADDSGLCVDALNGAPGVYSARYCGYHGSDKENRDLLLKNMQGIENRKANFTSAIALVYPDGTELLAEGHTYGKILLEEQGEGGFGYDCIFESEDLGKSFGVATAEEKNSVSHRFRALQGLLHKWKEYEGV